MTLSLSMLLFSILVMNLTFMVTGEMQSHVRQILLTINYLK